MRSAPPSESPAEKAVSSVNVCGPDSTLGAFQIYARRVYGPRGVSKAACEAFAEYLAKRGVKLAGDPFATEQTRLAKLASLAALQIDVDAKLDEMLIEAGALPQLTVLTGGVAP